MVKSTFSLSLALALVATSARAQDDGESALADEGLPHAFSLWTGPRYTFAFDPPLPRGHQHALALDLRSRVALGGEVAYLVGIDGAIGGGDGGFLYELEAHVLGIAARWDVGMVGLSGGIGFGGVTDSVPLAAQIPIELFVESDLGPIRMLLAATVRFALGAEARTGGSQLIDFADEIGASLYARIGDERRFWGTTVAGAGPALGLFYRERMDSRIIGVAVALSLSGGTR